MTSHLINLDIIKESQIQPYPYFHSEYQDIFDQDFYRQLVNDLPVSNDSYNFRYLKSHPERGIIRLLDNSISPAWDHLMSWVKSPKFKQLYLEKYAKYLTRFDNLDPNNFYISPLLIRDTNGYHVPPHTDTSAKAITIIIPLILDESLDHLGTNMFVNPRQYQKAAWDDQYQESFKGFIPYKKSKFLPNSCFEFVVGQNSWHGVFPIELDGDQTRNSLNISIKYHPN